MCTIMSRVIRFTVNDEDCEVKPGTDWNTRLVDYLRNQLKLRGTKYMCREGGCGACVVQVCARNPASGADEIFAVNSCLVLLFSCDGWRVTTVEGLDDRNGGYHIQRTLAEHGGSQCGYCSPGWVMSMSSLQSSGKKLTEKEIENSFGSNICRCTGYRPMLDAFKTFAVDHKVRADIADIENLDVGCSRMKCKSICKDKDFEEWCMLDAEESSTCDTFSGAKQKQVWYKPSDIPSIFNILNNEADDSYMLIAGNTSSGIYPTKKYPNTIIDLTGIKDLRSYYIDVNLVLGANMTLTDTMDIFQDLSQSDEDFEYLKIMYDHLDKIAHLPVRNIGTLAGNLMVKHAHNEFPSDIFLLFETVGATLTIKDSDGQTFELGLQPFLKTNMKKKLIVEIKLPPVSPRLYELRTFKIMPRSQDALALVNAGLFFKFNPSSGIAKSATLIFGNISPQFVHAIQTENFLKSKNIFNDSILQDALHILKKEIIPDDCPINSPAFREKLALGLFYKTILDFAPPNLVNKRNRSGGSTFERPVSRGTQVYNTNKAIWPINEPLPKVEALAQCSGEAEYINDLGNMRDEVYAALVYTTVTTGRIRSIDPSEALSTDGVIAFYKASDIPGDNNFTPAGFDRVVENEEIFCSGKVLYSGQPLGLIVARTEALANSSAEMVKVEYDDVDRDLILSVPDALNAPDANDRIVLKESKDPTEKGNDVIKVLKGTFSTTLGQYHFSMEPQTCITVPTDDGMIMYPSTQWPDLVHVSVAKALRIPQNSINVKVKRVGGSYGGKVTRGTQLAAACALATHKLRRPCRAVASFSTMMRVFGKRVGTYAEYEVGVNSSGEIQYLDCKVYKNRGSALNDSDADFTANQLKNCYDSTRWRLRVYDVRTDISPATFCRSPGSMEAIALTENLMERISYELKLSHISVRLANMTNSASKFQALFKSFLSDVNYVKRQKLVQTFNAQNRWIKRGLHVVPMNWFVHHAGHYNVAINVYHGDGTVVILHSGIEMGQGINTKVIQVCAHTLGIPVTKIKVRQMNSDTSPNASPTVSSIEIESVCYATIKASNVLVDRLAPIKRQFPSDSWEEIVEAAFQQDIELQGTFYYVDGSINDYDIWGVTLAEVELDLLTGNHQVKKVDLLEDCGQSLNPALDIGQIEGAFMMGQGYWTCENLIYKGGKLLTTSTLNYHVPLCKDIPIDFSINLKPNSYNIMGLLGSKTTSEPAVCMALAVPHALRAAIASSRMESGYGDGWFHIDVPYTNENMILAAQVKLEEMTLK